MEYKVGDIVKDPSLDLLDNYTAEWVAVGVVRITGVVEDADNETDN